MSPSFRTSLRVFSVPVDPLRKPTSYHIFRLRRTLEINPPEVLAFNGPWTEKIDNYALGMLLMLFCSGRFLCRKKGVEVSEAAAQLLLSVQTLRTSSAPQFFLGSSDAWQLFLSLTCSSPDRRLSVPAVFKHPWVVKQVLSLSPSFWHIFWHPRVRADFQQLRKVVVAVPQPFPSNRGPFSIFAGASSRGPQTRQPSQNLRGVHPCAAGFKTVRQQHAQPVRCSGTYLQQFQPQQQPPPLPHELPSRPTSAAQPARHVVLCRETSSNKIDRAPDAFGKGLLGHLPHTQSLLKPLNQSERKLTGSDGQNWRSPHETQSVSGCSTTESVGACPRRRQGTAACTPAPMPLFLQPRDDRRPENLPQPEGTASSAVQLQTRQPQQIGAIDCGLRESKSASQVEAGSSVATLVCISRSEDGVQGRVAAQRFPFSSQATPPQTAVPSVAPSLSVSENKSSWKSPSSNAEAAQRRDDPFPRVREGSVSTTAKGSFSGKSCRAWELAAAMGNSFAERGGGLLRGRDLSFAEKPPSPRDTRQLGGASAEEERPHSGVPSNPSLSGKGGDPHGNWPSPAEKTRESWEQQRLLKASGDETPLLGLRVSVGASAEASEAAESIVKSCMSENSLATKECRQESSAVQNFRPQKNGGDSPWQSEVSLGFDTDSRLEEAACVPCVEKAATSPESHATLTSVKVKGVSPGEFCASAGAEEPSKTTLTDAQDEAPAASARKPGILNIFMKAAASSRGGGPGSALASNGFEAFEASPCPSVEAALLSETQKASQSLLHESPPGCALRPALKGEAGVPPAESRCWPWSSSGTAASLAARSCRVQQKFQQPSEHAAEGSATDSSASASYWQAQRDQILHEQVRLEQEQRELRRQQRELEEKQLESVRRQQHLLLLQQALEHRMCLDGVVSAEAKSSSGSACAAAAPTAADFCEEPRRRGEPTVTADSSSPCCRARHEELARPAAAASLRVEKRVLVPPLALHRLSAPGLAAVELAVPFSFSAREASRGSRRDSLACREVQGGDKRGGFLTERLCRKTPLDSAARAPSPLRPRSLAPSQKGHGGRASGLGGEFLQKPPPPQPCRSSSATKELPCEDSPAGGSGQAMALDVAASVGRPLAAVRELAASFESLFNSVRASRA